MCLSLSLCRRVAKFSENYLRTIGSKTTASLEQTVNVQTEKFTEFEVPAFQSEDTEEIPD